MLQNNILAKNNLHQINTAAEIACQPQLWKLITDSFLSIAAEIEDFLQGAYAEADNIILTGAGTSAYIGLSLQGSFFRNTGLITSAVPTTNIVSHPHDYFNLNKIPLIISFARSGNSPESLAVIELADKQCKKCFHFIITCDENGALGKYNSHNSSYIFVLPSSANDKGLAMTGSYSGMLLTGLLAVFIKQQQKARQQSELVMQAAENILSNDTLFQQLAYKNFKRAVFLGSGSLFGTAAEAALKLQELTDGYIICQSETYLGLRHGPKAVIDETTLVVYFFSNNQYVSRYEYDLAYSMKQNNNVLFQLGISEQYIPISDLNGQINYGNKQKVIMEDFLPICAIIAGQLIGLYKSLQLGLMPDSPSAKGAISRVVQGVTIYPLDNYF